jgi:hypothetical protein
MTHHVLCDEFADRLADLLERDVDEVTRAALESHALSCDDCGSLLADLRKLRIDASNLTTLAPTRDLWQGIADRIDAPVIPIHNVSAASAGAGHRWRRRSAMMAAAAVLIAVTATSTHYLTVRGRNDAAPQTAAVIRPSTDSVTREAETRVASVPATDSAESAATTDRRTAPAVRQRPAKSTTRFASTKPSAEQVYATEIARLHAIVQQRRAHLDPVTISVIERNLKVIDDAIAQCRLALAKDPASRFLMESLNDAFETKVELLRTAAMLPARS